jgi:glycosyltransferase involved in cell wall biosynthesis
VFSVESLLSIPSAYTFFRLLKTLRQQSVDIANTFFFDATVFGVLAAKAGKISCIISSRRDMGFWYTPQTLTVLKTINRFVDRVLVNSEAIKSNVVKKENLDPSKVDVIYNGIDTRHFAVVNTDVDFRKEVGILMGDRIVGIAANLNRRVKRVDLFIKAAGLVLKEFKNTSFVILGAGDLMSELKNQAEQLSIGQKVYFLGFKKDIRPYISSFDIGVIASDSEGFSNAILEYAAAGIPVVTTDTGGNRELFDGGDFGELVPAGDAHRLAEGIMSLLRDNQRLGKISEQPPKLIAEEFDWKHRIKEIENYYLNTLDFCK